MVVYAIDTNSLVYHYDKLLTTLIILMTLFIINFHDTSVAILLILTVDIEWSIIVIND